MKRWLIPAVAVLAVVAAAAGAYAFYQSERERNQVESHAWQQLGERDRRDLTALLQREQVEPETTLSWLSDSEILVTVGEDEAQSTIWAYNIRSNTRRVFDEGRLPSVSPDRTNVAFVRGRILVVRNLESGVLTPVAQIADPLPIGQLTLPVMSGAFAWSADSRRLAFTKYRVNALGLPDGGEVFVWDSTHDTLAKIYSGADAVSSVSWSVADRDVIVASGPLTGMSGAIMTIHPESRARRNVSVGASGMFALLMPVASRHEDETIAYFADPVGVPPVVYGSVARVLRGQTTVEADHYALVGNAISQGSWSGDGSHYWYVCNIDGLQRHLCGMDASGGSLSTFPLPGLRRYGPVVISANDETFAFVASGLGGASYLVFGHPDTEWRSIALSQASEGTPTAPDDARLVSWESNGLTISGLLLLPRSRRVGERLPVLVDVHGGPAGGVSLDGGLLMDGSDEWRFFLDRGYAVFAPDYRLSLVYGAQPLLDSTQRHSFMSADAADVIAGLDTLVETGVVDTNRVALVGHSHGSLLANWLAANYPSRFSAVVSKEGESDWAAHYRRRPEQFRPQLEWLLGGAPDTASEAYAFNSPITNASRIDMPIVLLSAGRGTGREPFDAFAAAINAGGGQARHFHFSDEEHAFVSEEARRTTLAEAVLLFREHVAPWSADGNPSRASAESVQ